MRDGFPSLAERGKQPPRDPDDDYLTLSRVGDKLYITVVGPDKATQKGSIGISCRNAWTLIGLLSLFVGLKLPERIGKRIHL